MMSINLLGLGFLESLAIETLLTCDDCGASSIAVEGKRTLGGFSVVVYSTRFTDTPRNRGSVSVPACPPS